jgi:hypothetical protein
LTLRSGQTPLKSVSDAEKGRSSLYGRETAKQAASRATARTGIGCRSIALRLEGDFALEQNATRVINSTCGGPRWKVGVKWGRDVVRILSVLCQATSLSSLSLPQLSDTILEGEDILQPQRGQRRHAI